MYTRTPPAPEESLILPLDPHVSETMNAHLITNTQDVLMSDGLLLVSGLALGKEIIYQDAIV